MIDIKRIFIGFAAIILLVGGGISAGQGGHLYSPVLTFFGGIGVGILVIKEK
jgi:hypothetical protein